MYRKCRFCWGQGCLSCSGRGLIIDDEPIFVARTPEDLDLLKEAVGRGALEEAYAVAQRDPMQPFDATIARNLAIASFKQALRDLTSRPPRRARIYKVKTLPIETPGWDQPQWPKRKRTLCAARGVEDHNA